MKTLKIISTNQLIPGRIYRDTEHDDYTELRFIKKYTPGSKTIYAFELIGVNRSNYIINSDTGLVNFTEPYNWYEVVEVLNVKEGDTVYDSIMFPNLEGYVTAVSDIIYTNYPIKVKFGTDDHTATYTTDGRFIAIAMPTLSLKPYSVNLDRVLVNLKFGDKVQYHKRDHVFIKIDEAGIAKIVDTHGYSTYVSPEYLTKL